MQNTQNSKDRANTGQTQKGSFKSVGRVALQGSFLSLRAVCSLGSTRRDAGLTLDGVEAFPFNGAMASSSRSAGPLKGHVRVSRWQRLRGHLHGQRRRVATVAAAFLVVGLAYGVVFGHNGLTVYGRKRAETRDLDRELKTLTRENDALAGHVERLQSDPNAIEHQAREELHYTRPGEVIITLPPERSVKTEDPSRH